MRGGKANQRREKNPFSKADDFAGAGTIPAGAHRRAGQQGVTQQCSGGGGRERARHQTPDRMGQQCQRHRHQHARQLRQQLQPCQQPGAQIPLRRGQVHGLGPLQQRAQAKSGHHPRQAGVRINRARRKKSPLGTPAHAQRQRQHHAGQQHGAPELHAQGGAEKTGLAPVRAGHHALPDAQVGKHHQREIQRLHRSDESKGLRHQQPRQDQAAGQPQRLRGQIAAQQPQTGTQHARAQAGRSAGRGGRWLAGVHAALGAPEGFTTDAAGWPSRRGCLSRLDAVGRNGWTGQPPCR